MPEMSKPKVSALNSAPVQSKGCEARAVSGSERTAMTKATTPSGTLMAKSHGQCAMDSTPAAIVGPAADEMATMSALSETPRPSQRDG